ncbi:MAG: hypothetical protein LBS82_04970 [Spirochaetaceae bacterium]|nr:hypothetical protein [Spirochaetaceae bacterium]
MKAPRAGGREGTASFTLARNSPLSPRSTGAFAPLPEKYGLDALLCAKCERTTDNCNSFSFQFLGFTGKKRDSYLPAVAQNGIGLLYVALTVAVSIAALYIAFSQYRKRDIYA